MYPGLKLLIGGEWMIAEGGETLPVVNPGSGEQIGQVPKASGGDLEKATTAAQAGFETWRRMSAFERSLATSSIASRHGWARRGLP